MDLELPVYLKSKDFMEIMKDANDFDRNSLFYKNVYIGVIDILGYKTLLCELAGDAPKKLFEDILNAFSWAKTSHENLNVSLFSDTIIIESMDDHPLGFWNMIQVISSLRSQLLEKGILIRGGISFGNHFSQKGVLISPALVEAHILESKTAINPRIIISDNALKMAKQKITTHYGTPVIIVENYACKIETRMIKEDHDGLNTIKFDLNMVELRYLKYNEHPDEKNISNHIEHCISAGNDRLKTTMNGIKLAAQRAMDEKAKAKITYTISEWNSYLENFIHKDKFTSDYSIKN